MDPSTAVGAGLAILGSKDLMLKLLGPTAEYVGGEVKGLVAKCNINLDNIFKKAMRKLGTRADEPGEVNPRVLKHIFDEGRFCEDELAAEYYGGILASARSGNGRDDRGVTVLATVKDLSVYQLRTHFILYSLVHRLFKDQEVNLEKRLDCSNAKIFIPDEVYSEAMDFQPGEDVSSIVPHAFAGLDRYNLVSEVHIAAGPSGGWVPSKGIVFAPTFSGAEVFLWALGIEGASGSKLFEVEIEEGLEGVTIKDGARSALELQKQKKN
ncbi:hypothetical protein [Prosthecobacter sp.]|uniref:hypothetical protein n=1 Tax=Prosthecobacter sp. TaxID=1965333 RepID=UPI003BB15ABE